MMNNKTLHVQNYLQSHSLDDLHRELGIEICENDELVILNYNMIDSPKTNEIVKECRALTLEKNTWRVATKSFDRFFNYGEMQDEEKFFNWNNFTCTQKEDGSLIIIYRYKNQWRINTRGSFATGKCGNYDITWEEIVRPLIDWNKIDVYKDEGISFCFELVGPYNKVVRMYPESKLIMLSAFNVNTCEEYLREDVQKMADYIGVELVRETPLKSLEEIEQYLKRLEETDVTNEGIVVRDNENRRWKIKSKTYLGLHRMWSGDFSDKRLLPFVLSGEKDELLTYFPEVKDKYDEVEHKVWNAFSDLTKVWLANKDIPVQKDFALAILPQTKFTGMLFTIRKQAQTEGREQSLEDLEKLWRQSEDAILKVLFGR